MPTTTRHAEGHVYTYLDPDVRDRVDALADRLGVSRAAWVRMVVLEHLRAQDAEADGR